MKLPGIKVFTDNYRNILLYTILGIASFLVNIFSYYFFSEDLRLEYLLSNILSWSLSMLFGYITSRIFVFKSRTKTWPRILQEFLLFALFRLAALAMESFLLFVFFRQLGIQEMLSKLSAGAIAYSLNGIFNGRFVFRRKDKKNSWYNFFE